MYNANQGMYSGYEVEGMTSQKTEFKAESVTTTDGNNTTMPGVVCPPVYECPQERQIHREIVHEVPHVCPIDLIRLLLYQSM